MGSMPRKRKTPRKTAKKTKLSVKSAARELTDAILSVIEADRRREGTRGGKRRRAT